MPTYISILRGINVGGHKNIITYIQSGNVIFESSETNIQKLTDKIENRIKASLGIDVIVFVKTKNDIQKLLSKNPFSKQEINSLYVTFLSDIPHEIPIDEIKKAKDSAEKFFIVDKEVFLFCPNGYGRTKLSNNFFEKKLKLSATTRNWKTINKLLELVN